MSYADMLDRGRPPAGGVHGRRAAPEAGHRGGHRLRARRRVRAGAAADFRVLAERRQGRPARDHARRHPGCRRHPAAHPPGRSGQGQGPRLHRPPRRTPRRRWRSASPTGVVPDAEVYETALEMGRVVAAGRPSRCARPSRRSTRAWSSTSTPRCGWSPRCSPGCSPPRTRRPAWRRSSRTAPARRASPDGDERHVRAAR